MTPQFSLPLILVIAWLASNSGANEPDTPHAGQSSGERSGDATGACCGCHAGECGEQIMQCLDVTEPQCTAMYKDGQHTFTSSHGCASVQCPYGACVGRQGDCRFAHLGVCDGGERDGLRCDPILPFEDECPPGRGVASCVGSPGCDVDWCCTSVCDWDSFCCTFHWDRTCASYFSIGACDFLPICGIGDIHRDYWLDLKDYELLPRCMGGPGTPILQCDNMDTDCDEDVDLADVRWFYATFTGSSFSQP